MITTGVLPGNDPRNADWPTATVIGPQPDIAKTWACGPVLNQRDGNTCVGYAWAGALIAQPGGDPTATRRQGNALGENLYLRALNMSKYAIPSAGLGAQIAKERGLIDAYLWPTSLEELRDAVVGSGPVVIVVPWYESMYPRKSGRLPVKRSSNPGFHCLFVSGYDPAKVLGRKTGPAFLLRSSWGAGFPDSWVTAADLDTLLLDAGGYVQNACHAVGRVPFDTARVLAEHSTTHS